MLSFLTLFAAIGKNICGGIFLCLVGRYLLLGEVYGGRREEGVEGVDGVEGVLGVDGVEGVLGVDDVVGILRVIDVLDNVLLEDGVDIEGLLGVDTLCDGTLLKPIVVPKIEPIAPLLALSSLMEVEPADSLHSALYFPTSKVDVG